MTTVVCVHGVSRHREDFAAIWKEAILHDYGEIKADFVGVLWNPRDDKHRKAAKFDGDYPNWIKLSVRRGLSDAVRYIGRSNRSLRFREEAVGRCMRVIRAACMADPVEGVHVLGHSLGTVIAYQALHRLTGLCSVNTFFSVGSVLGFDVGIKPLLAEEVGTTGDKKLKRPPCDRWVNLMDFEDMAYKFEQQSVFDEVRHRPGDVDITGQLHESEGKCPALPRNDAKVFLSDKINSRSLCAHVYYFHRTSEATAQIRRYLWGIS